jgi:hypothetical protein
LDGPARYVITNGVMTESRSPGTGGLERSWEGLDERGRHLEIVAVERPDCWLVIHVMPTYGPKRRTP